VTFDYRTGVLMVMQSDYSPDTVFTPPDRLFNSAALGTLRSDSDTDSGDSSHDEAVEARMPTSSFF